LVLYILGFAIFQVKLGVGNYEYNTHSQLFFSALPYGAAVSLHSYSAVVQSYSFSVLKPIKEHKELHCMLFTEDTQTIVNTAHYCKFKEKLRI